MAAARGYDAPALNAGTNDPCDCDGEPAPRTASGTVAGNWVIVVWCRKCGHRLAGSVDGGVR